MKTIFASAIALSLLTGTAMAAPHDNRNAPRPAQTHQATHVQTKTQTKTVERKTVARHDNKQVKVTKVKKTRTARRAPEGEYRYKGKTYKAVRAGAWHAPRGYAVSQRFHRGQNLPFAYRNRENVVDYRAANLDRPAYGYEWVRVNNNVYLVSASNGLVAHIVWNIFR